MLGMESQGDLGKRRTHTKSEWGRGRRKLGGGGGGMGSWDVPCDNHYFSVSG